MIFRSQAVINYILSGAKYVATIRECSYYKDKVGKTVLLKLLDRRLKGKVLEVARVEDAGKYVSISGFRTVVEWLNEAKRLHGVNSLNNLCIVVVEVVGHMGK